MRALVVFFVCMLTAASANALPPPWNTVAGYMGLNLHPGSVDERILETYLDGVGEGFVTANAFLSNSGQAPLYCAPDIALNGKNYRSLLDEALQDAIQRDKARKPGSKPFSSLGYVLISIPLLQALEAKFPCEKK